MLSEDAVLPKTTRWNNVREERRLFSKDIYATVMQRLRQTRKKSVGNERDFVVK